MKQKSESTGSPGMRPRVSGGTVSRARCYAIPLAVFIVGLICTALAVWQFSRVAGEKDRERFRANVARAEEQISSRIQTYLAMLRAGAGLFAADSAVSAEEFSAYARQLNLRINYPGIQGIGWSKRILPQERSAITDEMRRIHSNFRLWPEQERSEYQAILYLEPLDRRNSAAIGYDMTSEPVRRAAMERARDLGGPAATGKVTLVQEIDEKKQAGFLIYMPVYYGGEIPRTIAERREKLRGYIYTPFRADDLFAGIFSGQIRPRVEVRVYDGENIEAGALLHSPPAFPKWLENPSGFTTTRLLDIAGAPWTLQFVTTSEFNFASSRSYLPYVLGTGVLASLLLAGFTFSLAGARYSAERANQELFVARAELERRVEERTRELGREKAFLEGLLESVEDGIAACDQSGRLTLFNRATRELFGIPDGEIPDDEWAKRCEVFAADGTTRLSQDEQPLSRALRGENVRDLEIVITDANGQVRTLLASGRAIFREGEERLGAVVSMHDITDRRLAEEAKASFALAQARRLGDERAATILESVTDAFYALDREWRFTYVNQRALDYYGMRKEHILGQVLWELFPMVRGSAFETQFKLATREQQTVEFEILSPFSNRWIDVRAYPSVDGLSVYFRDITERVEAEAAVRESRERLELAVGIAEMGTFEIDLVSGDVVVNEPGRTIYGWESVRTSFSEVRSRFHPDDREEAVRQVEAAFATDGPGFFEIEKRIHRVNGELRWLRLRGQTFFALKDGEQHAVRCVGAFLDVTERKLAEDALREREERLRLIMENVGDHAIFTLDLKGKVNSWNAGAEKVFGYRSDEVIGSPGAIFFTDEDRGNGRPEKELRKSASEGTVANDRWHVRKDGSIFWANGSMESLRDPQGRLKGYVKIIRDETERKRSEEQREEFLQREQRRSRQLHALAAIAARLTVNRDVRSVIELVTAEALKLIDSHEAGTVFDDSREPPEIFVSFSELRQQSSGGSPASFPAAPLLSLLRSSPPPLRLSSEEVARCGDFQDAVSAVTGGLLAVPLVGRDGGTLGMIYLADKRGSRFSEEDEVIMVQLAHLASVAIENARLYEELKLNDRRKDEFLAMLAHELRNPLAAVSNAVTVLKMSNARESVDIAKDIIERQSKQLARLIDDLLDVSRITSGKIRLRKKLLDAGAVLDQAVESTRPLVDERDQELIVAIDRGKLPLKADPMRLEQIVINLLTNAAKYTERGGKIWLSAGAEDEQVVIRVRDNGMGIPPERLPEMFQLFSQGERSIARSEGGLGIGLTIVQKLAEMHGGRVTATSEGPGKGSEFVVYLPLAEPAAAADPVPRGTAAARSKGSRILIVDDNLDTARGLARLLKMLGNEVEMAHDGPAAIEAARNMVPDFILLDIGLPGMDGYQVAAKLREEDAGCVIIAVTGYGQEEDRRRTRAAGFNHHLVKPVEFDALVSLMGNFQGEAQNA